MVFYAHVSYVHGRHLQRGKSASMHAVLVKLSKKRTYGRMTHLYFEEIRTTGKSTADDQAHTDDNPNRRGIRRTRGLYGSSYTRGFSVAVVAVAALTNLGNKFTR